jgi:small-conductance mechanosensitive channel
MFWHGPSIAEKLRAQHAVAIALAEAFASADISIPFPQRTLHFSSGAATLLSERGEES